MRGTPDIAAVANPMTPVWVYNSTYCPKSEWRLYLFFCKSNVVANGRD